MTVQIGVDTGGTHTDIVLLDREGGVFHTLKVPTTPEDLSIGILNGVTRILRETASRNTAENVGETRRLLEANHLSDCLLITSAYHMPRAKALFDRAGVQTRAWPSDYRSSGRVRLRFDFTQPSLNAQLASTAAREWAAILAARLTGRLPGL